MKIRIILLPLMLTGLLGAAPAAADCASDCLSRYACTMEFETGRAYGPGNNCMMFKSQCEAECSRTSGGGHGAVAIGEASGAWGLSDPSKDDGSASQSAFDYCGEHAADCKIAGNVKNGCLAVAQGGSITAFARGATASAAEAAAEANCEHKGGENCTAALSQCYFE